MRLTTQTLGCVYVCVFESATAVFHQKYVVTPLGCVLLKHIFLSSSSVSSQSIVFLSMELHGMELHGSSLRSMEIHGDPWRASAEAPIEIRGDPWTTLRFMELHGVSMVIHETADETTSTLTLAPGTSFFSFSLNSSVGLAWQIWLVAVFAVHKSPWANSTGTQGKTGFVQNSTHRHFLLRLQPTQSKDRTVSPPA